jgi:hypothetical protein
VTSGPDGTAGPACQLSGDRSGVCLADYVRVVLFWIRISDFMLIFENPYLLLGKSKNGKCGLFGNLEKISILWNHKILHVIEFFWCLDLSWKRALKIPLNLIRARSGVLDIQK